MLLQPILAIIILSFLRKSFVKTPQPGQWHTIVKTGIGVAVALIVLSVTPTRTRQIVTWLGHLMVIALAYGILTKKELSAAKQLLYSLLPLMAVNFIKDFVRLIGPDFYDSWSAYFKAAESFAFIWTGAMYIINNRQKKELEKERLKNEEKEKEFKISETLKAALEVQVNERTAEIMQQKEALEQTLTELKATQTQLIHSEKMASLGELTAGIAHEIQNPLNFVNNFSELNTELIAEMQEAINKGDFEEAKTIANDIADNEQKINHHGKRADGIVKGMLQHSRSSNGQKEPTDINALADEYLRLAYHGLRAKDKSFNAAMKTAYDETLGNINIIPQDMGRVILNLITNAFYAVAEKKKLNIAGYEPTVTVTTKAVKLIAGAKGAEITVADNGNGIPQKVLDKIFQPFFTTKPTGQGTGLGLSMSYDIVTKAHGGSLQVKTTEGAGAAFIITLPI